MAEFHKTDLTTDRDPDQARHRKMLAVGVWLAVYPTVTLCTYLTSELDVPTYVRTFITTILTVPLITYLVVPNAKDAIARLDPKADPAD